MVSTGEVRKGQTLIIDGELLKVIEANHVKQGRGSAFLRMTLRNVRTGSTTVKTFMAGERFETARLSTVNVQYLYREDDQIYVMNTETYDQYPVNLDILGDALSYIKENETFDLLTYGDEVLDVSLPTSVELVITDTEPNYRGDTATGGNKPATTDTGLVVQVPIFLSVGDKIRVDTRTGAYLTRV
ncbi:MAG: elongation factor P [Herpetosiphon sp.]|nr:elongation factor P [Herpetosiphon sp.]